MDIIWKGIVGGMVTALIAWLGKRGNLLPGIVPLFPTFSLIALYIVGAKGDPRGFREACTAAMRTLPAYLAFLIVCYVLAGRVDFRVTLGLGLVAWFVVALAIFVGGRYL